MSRCVTWQSPFRVGGLYLTRNRKHAVRVERDVEVLIGAFVEHGYLMPPQHVVTWCGEVVLHSVNNRYTWTTGGKFGDNGSELDLVEELGHVVPTHDGRSVVMLEADTSTKQPEPLPVGVKASLDTIATVLGVEPSGLTVTGYECERTADECRWEVKATAIDGLKSAKIVGTVKV